jgi:uncharacterized cysteine cluster protein YcgN (CxxCxxCC family)
MRKSNDQKTREWESLCRKCGRCCYEKIDFEGTIYYTDIPCEYLDKKTNLCRVYAVRDRKRPGCVRLDRVTVAKGFLPAGCPYVTGIIDYPAPVMPDHQGRDER